MGEEEGEKEWEGSWAQEGVSNGRFNSGVVEEVETARSFPPSSRLCLVDYRHTLEFFHISLYHHN